MLEELNIKNFALIESAHVEFTKGFTVLSGETGAGKSILIGSLAFLLGGKASTDQIRTGCHEAQVSGIFYIEEDEALKWLSERGIESEEGRVIVRRIIRDNGKSSSWIESVPVTRSDISDFSSFLVDIHGQHEQQSLMKVADHRRYLDVYAGIVDEVSNFTELYSHLVSQRHFLESLCSNETERKEKIELLRFSISEISSASLKVGEDEELSAEESKLSSFEKLFAEIEEINSCFEGECENGVISSLKRISSSASRAVEADKGLEMLESRLQNAFYEIEDIALEFRRYKASLVFDPDRLSQVQERLDLISKLKKKYALGKASSIQDVLDYSEKAEKQLEDLLGATEDRSELEKEISELEKEVYIKAKRISEKRKSASDAMSSSIENVLSKLGMGRTHFSVSLTEKEGNEVEQKCGPYGMDNVEFLISANPGSPLLPLAKIASGGELSRVMLALKTILSDGDTAGTLVFDEIDTGIGGEVAVSVGDHMRLLASKKQILCITHLASIAVCADNQIKIQKGVEGNTTASNVFMIEGKERVKEIARMLAGDSFSAQSLEHAESLLRQKREHH